MDHEQNAIFNLAVNAGRNLKLRGLYLTSAESCTGGWLGQAITAVAGSSEWYERGFITYSNLAKKEMLQVSSLTLERFGAVSLEVAYEMVTGALKNSSADIGVAITGIAGPSGGSELKPVGTVCFAWMLKNGFAVKKQFFFAGDREAVRKQAVVTALKGVLSLLDEIPVAVV